MFVFIDTACNGCNVALGDENGMMVCHQEPIDRGHADHIIPIFEKLLHDNGKASSDIDRVIVTVGPGSFTGLRVGITTARIMGMALDKPVHGITSFQSFSCGVNDDNDRLVIVETKRGDYYVQYLDANHKAQGEAASLPLDDLKTLINQNPMAIITGDAVQRLVAECSDIKNNLIQQDSIDLKTVTNVIGAGNLDLREPEAFYIREADVSQPKPR